MTRNFNDLQLIIQFQFYLAHEIDKLVTRARYQGYLEIGKSSTKDWSAFRPSWGFQPSYIHLHYLFNRLVSLALKSVRFGEWKIRIFIDLFNYFHLFVDWET